MASPSCQASKLPAGGVSGAAKRYRNTASCSRVTRASGSKVPSASPWAMPASMAQDTEWVYQESVSVSENAIRTVSDTSPPLMRCRAVTSSARVT